MRMLDLCAGIGGISLGAHWAGIETAAFCEIEPFCQQILKKHWPDIPVFDDVRTLNRQTLIESGVIGDGRTIDIISGGYPCQPFSVAGERRGEEDDRHLWPEFKRIIQEIRPHWFIGENVAGHVTLGLDTVLSDLESLDYTAQTFVIPAVAVNAPHRRDRVFIVAHTTSAGLSEWGRSGFTASNPEKGTGLEFESERCCTTLADSTGIGLQGQGEPIEPIDTAKNTTRKTSKSQHVRIGSQWTVEPNVGRVANGVSGRVDRLKALGNAVVPQQIYPIFESIMKLESKSK